MPLLAILSIPLSLTAFCTKITVSLTALCTKTTVILTPNANSAKPYGTPNAKLQTLHAPIYGYIHQLCTHIYPPCTRVYAPPHHLHRCTAVDHGQPLSSLKGPLGSVCQISAIADSLDPAGVFSGVIWNTGLE